MLIEVMNNKVVAFFFSNTIVGGAETNILKIAYELKQNNFKIHLLVLEDNGPLLYQVPKFYDSFEVIGRYEKNFIKSFFQFNNFLNKFSPAYISCFGLRVDLFVRLFKLLTFKKFKIIGNIRASENWRKKIHVAIDKYTSFMVTKWVSNSIAGMNVFINREKLSPNLISVIYNFIEYDIRNRVELRSEIDILRIGILANYKTTKGHFNLIEISKILSKYNINHIFICAGQDYTNGKFKNTIIENNLDNKFDLKGFIQDKSKFFNEIDVFLLPSYMEGLPTSVIEAMSFGIPVIASNIDGIPEVIINNYNGLLSHPNDINLFVLNLIKIKNIDLRIKFSDNGYFILDKLFNKQINMLKWITIFKS
jgi:glycosyltransferase involved in cell wall biosynthesis